MSFGEELIGEPFAPRIGRVAHDILDQRAVGFEPHARAEPDALARPIRDHRLELGEVARSSPARGDRLHPRFRGGPPAGHSGRLAEKVAPPIVVDVH